MNKVYDIILNMSKENPVFTGIALCQGDSGQTFNLHVTDFDTSGTTASIIFKKPDNNVVQATINAVNGVYSYTLRGSELSAVGKVVADIKFYDTSSQRISSTSFVLEVVADTLNPTAVESSSEFDALVRASNRALAAAEAAEGIVLQAIPTATENILGGVMSGGDVTVNSDGTMSVETIGDISEEPVTFSEAETDTELTSGSKLSILLGIIKKKFNVVNNNLTKAINNTIAFATTGDVEKDVLLENNTCYILGAATNSANYKCLYYIIVRGNTCTLFPILSASSVSISSTATTLKITTTSTGISFMLTMIGKTT